MFPEGRALEFLLAAVVALVVVGPKDLPILMRKLGQFIGKMRAMAAEFRASFDEMARQSELDELRKEVEAMRKAQFADIAGHAGAAEVVETFDGIRTELGEAGAELHGTPPPYYADIMQPQALPDAQAEAPPAKRAPRRKATAAATNPAPATRKAPRAKAASAKAPAKPRVKKKPEAEA